MHGIFWYNNNIHGGKDYSKEQQHTHGYRDESTPMWPSTIDVFYRPYVTLHLPVPDEEEHHIERAYLCFACDRPFLSLSAWSVHAFKVHGRINRWR